MCIGYHNKRIVFTAETVQVYEIQQLISQQSAIFFLGNLNVISIDVAALVFCEVGRQYFALSFTQKRAGERSPDKAKNDGYPKTLTFQNRQAYSQHILSDTSFCVNYKC